MEKLSTLPKIQNFDESVHSLERRGKRERGTSSRKSGRRGREGLVSSASADCFRHASSARDLPLAGWYSS